MTGNPILDSALILGGVGLFFGFVIAMVNKKFWVWEDPRIGEVEELLPSTNCGACGVAGLPGLCRGSRFRGAATVRLYRDGARRYRGCRQLPGRGCG